MRPLTTFAVTAGITAMFIAVFFVVVLPLGTPDLLETFLLALVAFPISGVLWQRHIRRNIPKPSSTR